jgi:hypothetical protein
LRCSAASKISGGRNTSKMSWRVSGNADRKHGQANASHDEADTVRQLQATEMIAVNDEIRRTRPRPPE